MYLEKVVKKIESSRKILNEVTIDKSLAYVLKMSKKLICETIHLSNFLNWYCFIIGGRKSQDHTHDFDLILCL